MTLKTNSRLAGFAFVFYIAIGLTTLYLSTKVLEGQEDIASKLENLAKHTSTMKVVILLNLLAAGCALVLAVTLYALTRNKDRDIAMMGMCCRVAEGIIIVASPLVTLAVLSVGSDGDTPIRNALGNILLKIEGLTGSIAAICFAVGSTFFCYIFLRAKSIPVWLAWLGVFASIVLVIILPLQLAGFVEGAWTSFVWIPMLIFELVLAGWLIVKGVAIPSASQYPGKFV